MGKLTAVRETVGAAFGPIQRLAAHGLITSDVRRPAFPAGAGGTR